MAFEGEDEIRIAGIEAGLADAVARIGALVSVLEITADFREKNLFLSEYDRLKPAE